MSSLAGWPLRYLIGKDNDPGIDGYVTEVGFDATSKPAHGIGIKYCNLFDEKNSGGYGPYLHSSDTAEQYDEGQIDPRGAGWSKNLNEQFERAKAQGFEYVELDNPDAYKLADVIRAIDSAASYGLKVIAKNPMLVEGDRKQYLAHKNVFGAIVEKGAGTADGMQALRMEAGRPDLPVWFVAFSNNGLLWARSTAEQARKFTGMSVTHSAGGEYVASQNILTPGETQMASWRLAKSLETLRSQINATLPNRSKLDDGTIGDTSHQQTNSDHNPNSAGVVTAMDVTHDPHGGFDSYKFADMLKAVGDKRVKYVISNRRIWTPSISTTWREYTRKNPHDKHVHISVSADPTRYDDPAPWVINIPLVPDENAKPVEGKPMLRRGSKGADVGYLQTLLGITADNDFGSNTEAAVRTFQSAHGLVADGIVGSYTWETLLGAKSTTPPSTAVPPPASAKIQLQRDIIASVFGGSLDSNLSNNVSAYTSKPLDSKGMYVALPFHFSGLRPKIIVTNRANGKSVICTVEDIGPWLTDDPYWQTKTRPLAEISKNSRVPLSRGPNKGRVANGAGIDISMAASKALGGVDMAPVDWQEAT